MTEGSTQRSATADKDVSELLIRDARRDELAAIVELSLAAYNQYASLMPHWTMYREMLISTLHRDSPAERIVAEHAGRLVGHVLLYPADAHVYTETTLTGGYPELRLLAVAPDARGLGVGGALLEECIRRARAAGATALGLHTEDVMEVAQRMYERRGFERAPETDFRPDPRVHVKGYRLQLR